MNLLAQLFGLIALLLLIVCYQQKSKHKFLFIQIFSNLAFGIQYILLNAYSASYTNFINIVRTIIFYNNEKNNKKNSLTILIIFELLFIISGIISYINIFSLFPIVIACLFTYGTYQNNMIITYVIAIMCAIAWIFYNYLVGAYVSILISIIELIAASIGLSRIKSNKKEKN